MLSVFGVGYRSTPVREKECYTCRWVEEEEEDEREDERGLEEECTYVCHH